MRIIIILLACFFLSSCSNDDEGALTDCLPIIINASKYEDAGNNYTLHNVRYESGCLLVNFGAGGCSGDNWGYEGVLRELPTTTANGRNIYFAFALDDNEECEAYITKDISFDLLQEVSLSSHSVVNIYVKGYENNPIVIN